MNMKTKEAYLLMVGDVILIDAGRKGPRQVKVSQVEHNACNKGDTHINNEWCYAREAQVVVKA
jgi:hypothetical protein